MEEYVNSKQNISKRRLFAIEMINILNSNKRIINFDETLINSSTSRMRSWTPKSTCKGRIFKKLSQPVSLLLSVS